MAKLFSKPAPPHPSGPARKGRGPRSSLGGTGGGCALRRPPCRGSRQRRTHPPQGPVPPSPQYTPPGSRQGKRLPTRAVRGEGTPYATESRKGSAAANYTQDAGAGGPTQSGAGLSNRGALQSGPTVNTGSSPSRSQGCSALGRGWRLSRVLLPRETPPLDRRPGQEPR